MTPVRLEPAPPRSQVKHFTTESLFSHQSIDLYFGQRTCEQQMISSVNIQSCHSVENKIELTPKEVAAQLH